MDIQALLQVLAPQRATLSGGLDSLKAGDRLSGRILEHRPDGQTLVDFGRFRALAELKVPLPQNAMVNLQVMETGEKVRMSIVTPGQGTQTALEVPLSRFEVLTGDLFQQLRGDIQQLLTLAPRSASARGTSPQGQAAGASPGEGSGALPAALRAILSQVQAQLTPIDPRARMDQLLPQVRSAVVDSGIYFEKRLEGALRALQARLPDAPPAQLARQPEIRQLFNEDLKPNLLILKENIINLFKERNPEMETALHRVRTTVEHLLADIDHQQRQMISRAFGPEPEQVLSHWLHIQDNPHLSRLKIFHRKHKDDAGDAAPRVSLLLDMDRLGEVRTDLFLTPAQLNLHFFVTSESVKARVEAHLDELTPKLEDGARGVSVQVTVSRDQVDRLKREPALPAVSRGLVDLKA